MIVNFPGIGPRRVPDDTPQADIDQWLAFAQARITRETLYATWSDPKRIPQIDALLLQHGFDVTQLKPKLADLLRERVRLFKSGQLTADEVVPVFDINEVI